MDMVRLSQFEHEREQLWLDALAEHPDGLTQAQLAALVGMTPGHVSRRLARARQYRLAKGEMHDFELIESPNPIATHGCERHHLIQVGDRKVCLACGLSGMDHATPFAGVIAPPASQEPKPTMDQPAGPAKFKPKIKRPKSRPTPAKPPESSGSSDLSDCSAGQPLSSLATFS